uniref:J domain-containing protein n=1 Tax=Fagus sylvatica TaxID=28930 RepID=A0A2N9FLW0_FAGSY
MASEKPKRCHYEVLGLSRNCSADEIRSAYKKMALQRHPDKLILFSNLANSGGSNSVLPNSAVPNLFSFFSNTVFTGYSDSSRRFYKVYSDLFDKIYANELNFVRRLGLGSDSVREAPVMGNLDSPYAQGDGGGEQETEEEGEEGVQRLCIKEEKWRSSAM